MTDSQDFSPHEVNTSEHPLTLPEQAFNSLIVEFSNLFGYRQLPVVAEFERIESSEDRKAILWEAESFTAAGVDYGVIVRITGEEDWCRSVVVFPATDSATPILALLLCGDGEHLSFIVADLIPLSEQDRGVMDEVAMGYETLGSVPALHTEILITFSRSPIIRKLNAETNQSQVIHLIREISALWFEYIQATTVPVDELTKQSATTKRRAFCQAHSDNKLLLDYLAQAFGKSLSEKLLTQVIFQQERSQSAVNSR